MQVMTGQMFGVIITGEPGAEENEAGLFYTMVLLHTSEMYAFF